MSRNVKALSKVLESLCGRSLDFGATATCDRIAAWLASKNILAVDSLTDEQVEEIHAAIEMEPGDHIAAGRAALRRCATGVEQ